MFFHADLSSRQHTMSDGKQPGFPVAVTAPIDGNGFEAEIEGGEMRATGDASLAQDRGGKQSAKPRGVLKHGQLIPGVEDDNGLQRRRQVLTLSQDAAPFVEPGILVPVEIIDERILFGRPIAAGAVGTCCVLDRSLRSGEDRIDGRIVDAVQICGVIFIMVPLPVRIDGGRGDGEAGRARLVRPRRCDFRGLSQNPDTVRRQRPTRRLARNASACSQNVAGDGDFVGWRAGIAKRIVKDEVFEMHQLAVDPQRGTGVGEILPLKEACADRRASNALVETGERDAGVERRPRQG